MLRETAAHFHQPDMREIDDESDENLQPINISKMARKRVKNVQNRHEYRFVDGLRQYRLKQDNP
jgi:non-canonical (house-cleaning) NTP pyrophosphatase